MIVVCISRASFLFRSWWRKLQEAETVDVILSFNNYCDRQQNQSDFQMVYYDHLFLFGAENCVSILFGNGVKLEFRGNAL